MSTPKFIEIQKSFSDLKFQTAKYLACIQKNSLLPFATICFGVIIGIMLFYVFLISIISLGIGISIKFVLPKYDLVNITRKHFYKDDSNSAAANTDISKLLMKKGVEIVEIFLKFTYQYGKEHFILGTISIISCIILSIAIGKKLQIIFFVFLLIFFILGCYFIEFGINLWPLLLVKLKEILTFAVLKYFDWDLCSYCESPINSKKLPINADSDIPMGALKKFFNCCGVDSPEDFGKKTNKKRIPYACCVDFDANNFTFSECIASKAPPGCFGIIVQKIEKYKLYFDFYMAAYVVCGLLLFSIVIIGILQTIYFYLSGSHKTDSVINQ